MKVTTTVGAVIPLFEAVREHASGSIRKQGEQYLILQGESITDEQKKKMEIIKQAMDNAKKVLAASDKVLTAISPLPQTATIEIGDQELLLLSYQ